MRRARSNNRELDDRRHFVCLDFKNMAQHGAAIRGYKLHPVQLHTASFIHGDRPEWVGRLKVLLGFRFSAKSWKLRQWVKFRWLRCPWMQFILHSSNDQMAKRFVRAIKDELAYDPLTSHLIPEPSASDFEFNLRGIRPEQGTSLVAAGIRTSMTGSRADGYLFDDPEPEVDPEAMYDRLMSAFSEAGSILHAPDRHLGKFVDEIGRHPTEVPGPEQTQMIVVGQPHCATTAYLPRDDDLDAEGEGHPLRSAKFLIIPAVQKNGDWTWPEQMHRKYYNFSQRRPMTVAEVKATMTTSRWELQYQINTEYAQKAGPVLRLREILLHTQRVPDPIMIVDPADSEEGCVLPGTLVEGSILDCTKAWYHGPAVEIVADSVPPLRVTANHPVLTSRGWKRAQQLQPGDELVGCPEGMAPAMPRLHQDQHAVPAVVEQVFEALFEGAMVSVIRSVSPTDLHGDGQFIHGDVYCVSAVDQALRLGRETSVPKNGQNLALVSANREGRPPSPSKGNGRRLRHGAAPQLGALRQPSAHDIPTGVVTHREFLLGRASRVFGGEQRRDGLGSAAALGGRPLRRPEERGSQQANGLPLRSRLDATTPQSLNESMAVEAQFLSELRRGLAGQIPLHRVREVRPFFHSSHVYNLHTEHGWFSAGGIISKNCEWGISIGGMFRSKAHLLYLGGMQGEAYFDFDLPAGASIWRDVFDLATEFGVVRVYLEKNLKAAAVSCRRYIQAANISVTVEEYAAKMNKLRRICEALEQPVNNGIVTAHPRVLADAENVRELSKLRWDRLPKPNDRLDVAAELVNRLLEEPAAAMPYGVAQPKSPEPTGGSFSRVVTARSSFERLQR